MTGALPTRELFGFHVSALDADETLEWILQRAADRRSTNVAALNAGKVVATGRDPTLRRALSDADIIVPDGKSIVWASRFLGAPLPGRVAGIDLMIACLGEAERRGLSVYLLGARPSVLETAVTKIAQRYPDLNIAGHHDGYFSDRDEPRLLEDINASGASLLFLGMSSPKKEVFSARNAASMTVPVLMGVGGSFDVIAGVTRRAPRWMQGAGLEWLYRFLQEPRRMWRRYILDNVLFVARLFRERRERNGT